MRIRTITYFIPLNWPFDEGSITGPARFLADARQQLTEAGVEVQATCLATPPFLDVLAYPDTSLLLEFAQKLEILANTHHIDAVSVGPVVATTPLSLLMSIHALPRLIAETKKIYSGVLFADEHSGVNLAAAQAFAKTVHTVAQATPNGIGNLRLGAMANVPPNMPFPHVAYHHGGRPCFALATEATDLALAAVDESRTLKQASEKLIESIENAADHILEIVDGLVDDHQIRFRGIDFSLIPSPGQTRSIGTAIESLGIDAFGGSGTLFALAFLTNALKQTTIPHAGFSGIMLPVLEDTILAERAAEGRFSVNDLLLYSTICGAGLDIVPIPGNTDPDEIGALYLDMAALAISVGRPLSARLLPIPGLAVGEKVNFDSPDLSSSCVLPVKNLGVQQLFEQNSFLTLQPLPSKQRTQSETYPSF